MKIIGLFTALILCLSLVSVQAKNGPPIGTRLVFPDGSEYVYQGWGRFEPTLMQLPPPDTLIYFPSSAGPVGILVDIGSADGAVGIDMGLDGTVDFIVKDLPDSEGPPDDNDESYIGTRLVLPDGTVYTYLGDGKWDPPMLEDFYNLPVGTLVYFPGDDEADGVFADEDGDGKADGIDMGMDGDIDYYFDEGPPGDGDEPPGGGTPPDDGGGEGGMPIGMQLDFDADGVWDTKYLGNGEWTGDFPEDGVPGGTLVDMDGDGEADGKIIDTNGDGLGDMYEENK